MKWLFRGAPEDEPQDIIAWAEEHVRLVGSVRSERYDRNITPWTIEPIQRAADKQTKIVTLVKPVQTGGSRVGLILLCWWSKYGYGQLQYNWEKDEKAEEKWANETLPTLENCRQLEWAGHRFDSVKCKAIFRRTFIRAQGVFIPENLDSDSIPFQVNEEIHSWKPGHLAKARGRQTAVWFPKAIDISNAGNIGDQLQQAFEAGTMQFWEVKCPGCSQYHRMRTRWEDAKPELGGLRYDADGCRLGEGKYDYNKLEKTIRYQMPCGHLIRDIPSERRALSLSGHYSEPTNEGAHLSHRSYTYEAVAVDFIPWLLLIQEKHAALRSMKLGDLVPWQKYLTERECSFYDIQDRPFVGKIILNIKATKNRDGMPKKVARLFALDRQKGLASEGETPHWWLVIRDVGPEEDGASRWEVPSDVSQDYRVQLESWERTIKKHPRTQEKVEAWIQIGKHDHLYWCECAIAMLIEMAGHRGSSMLVYEGKLYTENDVLAVLAEHKCEMQCGVADATWDTTYVQEFCYRNGINAVFATDERDFSHGEEGRKIFAPEEPLHLKLNRAPRHPYLSINGRAEPNLKEPLWWRFSKFGIMDRLDWLRGASKMNLDKAA